MVENACCIRLFDSIAYFKIHGFRFKYIEWYQKLHNSHVSINKARRFIELLNDCYHGKRIIRGDTAEIWNNSLNLHLTGLIAQLEEEGYSPQTVHNYYKRLRPIQNYMRDNNIDEYSPSIGIDYFDYYLQKHHPGVVHKRELFCAILRLNDHFQNTGMIYKHHFSESSSIPDSFIEDVERFFKAPEIVSVKTTTIRRRTRALSKFLMNCIRCGVSTICSLTPQAVALACADVTDIDQWITIRQFLRFLAEEGSTDTDLSTFVPTGRREIKAPSTYSIDDLHLMESFIDRSTYQGKRDYIVMLMADRLTIRSGDIAAMRVESLDFNNSSIRFLQQKTGNEIMLPMIPELKEALKIYLRESDTKDGYLFHGLNAPHAPLQSCAINGIVNKYFKIAGIDTTGKKHGPHSLRASASTSMINDDIPYDIVRNVLGHTSPNAIRSYAKNDIEKLRRCSIPVPSPSGKFLEFLKGGADN